MFDGFLLGSNEKSQECILFEFSSLVYKYLQPRSKQ